jgi:hypothetical protein
MRMRMKKMKREIVLAAPCGERGCRVAGDRKMWSN